MPRRSVVATPMLADAVDQAAAERERLGERARRSARRRRSIVGHRRRVLDQRRRTRRRRAGPRCRAARSAAAAAAPTAISSWSPTSWPSVSLTTLKSSRSMKSTPTRPVVASRGAGHRLLDPVGEQHPVGQAGERVVERPVRQLPLQPPLLGDVAQGEDEPARRSGRRAGRGRRPRPARRLPSARSTDQSSVSLRVGAGRGSSCSAPATGGPRRRGDQVVRHAAGQVARSPKMARGRRARVPDGRRRRR